MNLEKSYYITVVSFGTLDDMLNKLTMDKISIEDIINTKDKNGLSLLEVSLSCGKFDIANYLIDKGALINNVEKKDFNELHLMAPFINEKGGVKLAEKLIKYGVDLNEQDKVYLNTAALALCLKILTKRDEEGIKFINEILLKKSDVNIKNKSGLSIKDVIEQRGLKVL